MVQEWITSSDEIINRIEQLIGIIKWLKVSSKRKFKKLFFIIESIFRLKFIISYDQYHWCPIIFTVKSESFNSSHI